MPITRWASIGLVIVLVGRLGAQMTPEDRPTRHVAVRAVSRAELDRLEARRLYGLAALQEHKNRLVEAVSSYEAAQRLDPDSLAIPRALLLVYLALDRTEDAFLAAQKVLRLDPGDYHTAFLYARQLRGIDRRKEAETVLELASRSPRLMERPDLAAQIWFDLGLLREQANDLKQAEACLRQVVAILDRPDALLEGGRYSRDEINAQAAESCEKLGRLCLKNGKVAAAVEAFEKAKTRDSLRAPRLAYNLAQVFRDQKRYEAALTQLETYLHSQPPSSEGYELRIDLQRRLGREGDVVRDLEASSAGDPHNPGLRLLLAREYRKVGRAMEAERIYKALLAHQLTPEVYRGLFDLYREQGYPGLVAVAHTLDDALKAATGEDRTLTAVQARRARAMLTVLREDPALVKLLLPVALRPGAGRQLSYTTRGVLATLAARTRQLAEAEALYRACLERESGMPQTEADVYIGLLRVLRLQHKHQAVIDLCQRGLKDAQQTSRVLFHTELVRAYQMLDRHREAVAAAEAAVTDAGKGQMLLCKRIHADALSQAGQHAQALAECQALLREYNQGGELRDVRSTLSLVYQAMGKHDEAERQLLLILESDPNDATANNDLGYHWADRTKNLDEAEKRIRKAIELDHQQRAHGPAADPDADKDNAAYVDSLGWVLFRRGKLEEACQELERATTLPGGDDDPVVWDHLGDVYHRLGKAGQAEQAWKRALALYELGTRRRGDGRMRDLQEKLRLSKPSVPTNE